MSVCLCVCLYVPNVCLCVLVVSSVSVSVSVSAAIHLSMTPLVSVKTSIYLFYAKTTVSLQREHCLQVAQNGAGGWVLGATWESPPQFGLVEGIRLSNVTFSKKLIDQFFKS